MENVREKRLLRLVLKETDCVLPWNSCWQGIGKGKRGAKEESRAV